MAVDLGTRICCSNGVSPQAPQPDAPIVLHVILRDSVHSNREMPLIAVSWVLIG